MGTWHSRSIATEPAPKVPKLDRNNCSAVGIDRDHQKQYTSLESRLWGSIPYVALVEVYRCLPNTDKLNASLVCKAWSQPFSRPALWRRGNFRFNGKDDWRALSFASMMGEHLRHVVVDCSACNGPRIKVVETVENLTLFLRTLLIAKNDQLETLALTECRRLVKHFSPRRRDVCGLLKSLLSRQTGLKTLDLSNARVTHEDGIQLLQAACAKSAGELHTLVLDNLFCMDSRIHDHSSFLLAMAAFKNVVELSLGHSCLSDELLFLLSHSLASRLQLMRVSAVSKGWVGERRTSPVAWSHLSHCCPGLKAHFTLKGVSYDQGLTDILTQSIPLVTLHLEFSKLTTMVNTQQCFQHLHHFKDHLHHLVLDVGHSFLHEEEDILPLLNSCTLLKTCSIQSEVLSPPRLFMLQRAIKHIVTSRPDNQLQTIIVNQRVINLDETIITSMVSWLMEFIA